MGDVVETLMPQTRSVGPAEHELVLFELEQIKVPEHAIRARIIQINVGQLN